MLYNDIFGESRRRIRRTGLYLLASIALSVAAVAGAVTATADATKPDGGHAAAGATA